MDNSAEDSDMNLSHSQEISAELQSIEARLEKVMQEREAEREIFLRILDSTPVIMWTSDQSGKPQFLTKNTKPTAVLSWQTVEENGWSAGVDDKDRSDVERLCKAGYLKGKSFELELHLKQQDGSMGWYLMSAYPAQTVACGATNWVGSCRNIDAEKKLVAALQSALQTKSNFIAQVSHELRTPLNGILPMVEMMLRGELSNEVRTYAMTLKDAGSSLLNIINDVLDFSKLEAGKVETVAVDFDLIALVESVVKILRPAAACKNLILDCSISPMTPTYVTGDPQRLKQVLLNLCHNAVKFTEKGQVSIDVRPAVLFHGSNDTVFSVTDTGPGLNQEMLAHLFEPFFQGCGEAYRNKAGTGLGLSISKRFVELLGGKMFVEGQIGIGSTFGFTIPLQLACTDAKIFDHGNLPDGTSQDQPGQRSQQSITLQLDHDLRLAAHNGHLVGRSKQVLVADDNEISRHVAFLFLSGMGLEVDLADDGVEAVHAFKSKDYDLVFLDCQMPRIGGFEAAKIIREIQRRRGTSIPVIAVTSNAMEGTMEDCLAHDMDDYLSKPLDPSALERLVGDWLGPAARKEFQKLTRNNPADGAKSPSNLVNLSKLGRIFSEPQMTSLLELFVESFPAKLNELQQLLTARDYTNFERRLNSFNDSCMAIQATTAAHACAEIMESLQRLDIRTVRKGLDDLARLLQQVQYQLNAVLADRSTCTLPSVQQAS